jgi:hypothetical protein
MIQIKIINQKSNAALSRGAPESRALSKTQINEPHD